MELLKEKTNGTMFTVLARDLFKKDGQYNQKLSNLGNRFEKLKGINTEDVDTEREGANTEGEKSKEARFIEWILNHLDKYILQELPQSYIDQQVNILFNQTGITLSPEEVSTLKVKLLETEKTNQLQSLESWFKYMLEEGYTYPDWYKYYVLRSVVSLNKKGEKRSKGRVELFPPLDQAIIAQIYDELDLELKAKNYDYSKISGLIPNFGKEYYDRFIKKLDFRTDFTQEEIQKGEWVTVKQSNDPDQIKRVADISAPTVWCIAGTGVATDFLAQGDIHFFMVASLPTSLPAICIRTENGKIAEIRGTKHNQHLSSDLEPVLAKKLIYFSDADSYLKKTKDAQTLTEIYQKHTNLQELTSSQLRFIYELDGKITTFGYQEDPRVESIKADRNIRNDLAKIFECQLDQISFSKQEFLYSKVPIIFHYDDLDFSGLTTLPPNFKLPKEMSGDLDLGGLTELQDGIIFPEKVRDLILAYLTQLPASTTLPKKVRNLNLTSLNELPEGVIFPQELRGNLNLSHITKLPKRVTLPNKVGSLILRHLINLPEDITFPEKISDLILSSLTKLPPNFKFPEKIRALNLESLTKLTTDIVLPKKCDYLYLNGLDELPADVALPKIYKKIFIKNQEIIFKS